MDPKWNSTWQWRLLSFYELNQHRGTEGPALEQFYLGRHWMAQNQFQIHATQCRGEGTGWALLLILMKALPDAQGQAGDRAGQISYSAPKPALTLAQRLLCSHAHPEWRLRDRGSGEGLEKGEGRGERRQEKQGSPAAGELGSPAKSSPNTELLTGKENNPTPHPPFSSGLQNNLWSEFYQSCFVLLIFFLGNSQEVISVAV